jgi:hypothetical protein
MRKHSIWPWTVVGIVLMCFVAGSCFPVRARTQNTKPEEAVSLDSGKMGVYRALAGLTLQAYRRGDFGAAQTLAQVLNAAWNNTERVTTHSSRNGQASLERVNRDLCEKIDSAMDDFSDDIRKGERPPIEDVERAYKKYLDLLRLAD